MVAALLCRYDMLACAAAQRAWHAMQMLENNEPSSTAKEPGLAAIEEAGDSCGVIDGSIGNVDTELSKQNPSAVQAEPVTCFAAGQMESDDVSPNVTPWSEAAVRNLGRFKLHFLSGDFGKQVSGKRKLLGKCCVATVGNRHVHHLKAESRLARVLQPGTIVAAESATHLVQLKPEHVAKFEDGAEVWAQDGGFVAATDVECTAGHMLFKLPQPACTSG